MMGQHHYGHNSRTISTWETQPISLSKVAVKKMTATTIQSKICPFHICATYVTHKKWERVLDCTIVAAILIFGLLSLWISLLSS